MPQRKQLEIELAKASLAGKTDDDYRLLFDNVVLFARATIEEPEH